MPVGCAADPGGCGVCRFPANVPLDQIDMSQRVLTQEAGGLRVSAAVLSRSEAAAVFGVNLHKRGIQPIWLEIENQTGKPFWLMLHGLDPNYFSANEVAYINHKFMRLGSNAEMDRYFSELGIEQNIAPGQVVSGFAFSNETIGTKEVRVRLYSDRDVRNFEFFVSVPGMKSEWERRDYTNMYSPDELILTETDEQLHEALLNLDCCTRTGDGSGRGLPVNAVFFNGRDTIAALIKAGWDETAFQSDRRDFFGADYFFGRQPDAQFSKTRRRVDSTNSVRLWLSPIRHKGDGVIVGSISRSIDPNIDEAAVYLAEDLAVARTVVRWGFVDGASKLKKSASRKVHADVGYRTNGNRLVLQLSQTPVELDQIDIFGWDWKGRRFRRQRIKPKAGDGK